MKIIVEATPQEIAALVLAIQERQSCEVSINLVCTAPTLTSQTILEKRVRAGRQAPPKHF